MSGRAAEQHIGGRGAESGAGDDQVGNTDFCRLDDKFVDVLERALCLPKCPPQIQVLCAAILREMSPSDKLTLSCHEIQETKLLSTVGAILLAQVNALCGRVFKKKKIVFLRWRFVMRFHCSLTAQRERRGESRAAPGNCTRGDPSAMLHLESNSRFSCRF